MSESLNEAAQQMVQKRKGLLAADESNKTAKKRLEAVGAEDTEEMRRKYREVFLTADGIEEYLSGVILFDETFRQSTGDGVSFVKLLENKGILPGIKVDMSTVPFGDSKTEVVTAGLNGLADRLDEYRMRGARFTKWRAVIRIGEGLPTEENLRENAQGLAEYARLAQKANLVPIIEPEVLLEGSHSMEEAAEVTEKTLKIVFEEIDKFEVELSGLILKSSMVVPGNKSGEEMEEQKVAEETVRVLKAAVPEDVPGVVFLSGGQTAEQATNNLRAMALMGSMPWELTFSYARALQGAALEAWRGSDDNFGAAQQVFLRRLKEVSEAREGKLRRS